MTALDLQRVTGEDDLLRWWQLVDVAMAADHVALPADPAAELAPLLAGPVAGYDEELWLALAAGRPVGCARLTMPRHDNLHTADLDVTVHPAERGRGLGSRLVEGMLARVREHGRSTVNGAVCRRLGEPDGPVPAARIAARLGAAPALLEVRRLLDLTQPPPAGLAELANDAAERGAGYTLVRWVGRAADGDVDDLTVLMAAMSTDAPQGDLGIEPESWDVARYRDKEAATEARGRRRYAVAAREQASGRLVGFTEIGVNPLAPTVGYQWDTLVRREHRGHRLGLLMKLANHQQLRARCPQTRYLNTWNAASNVPMVAVNDALGYRPVEEWQVWQLRP